MLHDAPRRRAVDIAELVIWTYQAQAAAHVYSDGLWAIEQSSRPSGGDSCDRLARRTTLGCRIDGGGWRGLGRLHPDAETVHECVLAMRGAATGRIIRFGRSGCIPGDLGGATIRLRARQLKGGRPAWIKDEGGE